MQMRRQYCVNLVFFKHRHQPIAEIKKMCLALRSARLRPKAVEKDIAMHQSNLPRRLARRQIPFQPRQLVCQQIRLKIFQSPESWCQVPYKMHRTVIKAVKLIRIFCQTVLWHIKQMRIACRQAFLPLHVICLMVADYRCQRHSITEHAHTIEPRAPLACILTIIYQIAHIHIKCTLRMTLVRFTRQLLPAAVISALRIRED